MHGNISIEYVDYGKTQQTWVADIDNYTHDIICCNY